MFRKLHDKVSAWQRAFNSSFGDDISTPRTRALARLHTHLVDHAFIRRVWGNMFPLGAHAWRSNQPGTSRFPRLQRMGIRTIVNLRGKSAFAHYLFEREACAAYDIDLIDIQLNAYKLDDRDTYLRLLQIFDRAEKPMLMHCKSGADRSGIAAALYLIDQEGVTPEEAKRQLSLKYLHRSRSKAGILGFFLNTYARDAAETPMPFRTWLLTRYDRAALTRAYNDSRAGKPSS